MSLFDANTSAIISRYPRFAREILKRYTPQTLAIETTTSGELTVRDGDRYLHSRRNPVREADRSLEISAPHSNPAACICLGFGLGYFVESAIRRFPGSEIIIIEPDVPFFLGVLEHRDLTASLAHSHTHLILGAEDTDVAHGLGALPQGEIALIGPRSLYSRNIEYFDRVRQRIERIMNRREINRNTLHRFGSRWIRNLSANLSIFEYADRVVNMRKSFAGVPALVLAAGPSLDEIKPHLQTLSKRSLIIAVDTSLRVALAAGIDPDFTVVVDPQYWNTRHLDRCDGSGTILLSESSTHPSVFRGTFRRTMLCSSLFPLGTYLESKLGSFGTLGAGGSVATTAWDFARFLGCEPIYVAGLDLGYPDLKTHVEGSLFEERTHIISDRRRTTETMGFLALHDANPYPVISNSGGSVFTDQRLAVYREWFESQIAMNAESPTINLSSDGVRIEGMSAGAVTDLFERPPIRKEIDRRLSANKSDELRIERPIAGIVEGLISELDALSSIANRGLSLVDGLVRKGGVLDAGTLRSLDEIDEDIRSNSGKEIAGFLLQNAVEEIDSNASDPLDQSTRLYRRIFESARFHIDLLRRGVGLCDTETLP